MASSLIDNMTYTINNLKNLWEKEKNEYKAQEVGSGVQQFVKKVFKCEEIFNLKEGALATPDEKRNDEFLEEKAKKSKRADVIVYIDAERIIPVEVEKYTKIEAGVKQLFDYQLVWDKKYGILTDGYRWRFYNNTILLSEFTIENIFNETAQFLEFWKEYIQPENYYLSFFERIGQGSLFEEDISVDIKREDFFKDITTLISSFKNKLNIKGYFDKIGEQQSEKRAVEITYAYIIQFILYKTLVDNDFSEFKKDFEERIINVYEGFKNKSYHGILTSIKAISSIISKNVYRPFSKEQEFINKTLEEILIKPKSELTDVTPWLDIFIFIKRYSFANVRNEIFGYIYENYLKDLYLDEQKGQYFTDPSIVNFMLQQAGYTSKEIKKRLDRDKDSISLIDPSCGSGTFLYSATNEIINAIPNGSEQSSRVIEELANNNIFGLDIAEFPLYLAEMNIIMRMLPLIITEKYNNPIDKKIKVFKTKDSIAEFLDTAIKGTLSDLNVAYHRNKGQLSIFTQELNLGYSSYVRDEDDLNEMKKSLENHPRISRYRYRFDFVIGNPPYISYNKCSQQKLLFFEYIKEGKAKLNDVYSVNLHSIPNNPKRYRPNPNLWAFFIALGLALLKDGGKLCYIIPQTILINPDFDVIRYHLAKFTTIEKIITFSGKMFIGRGIKQNKPVPTSSLIFVISKKPPETLHQVEASHYKNPNDEIDKCLENIAKGRNIQKNKILQMKLLQNIDNWNIVKLENKIREFYESYKSNSESISIYSEHVLARQYLKSEFYFDGGYSIDEKQFLESPLRRFLNYKCPKLDDQYWTIKSFIGYWPNVRNHGEKMFIELRQGNQGYNFIDQKYKIVWSYNNTTKFFYTDENIIWARNKFLGISSNNKNEIFYLFSLLNSKVTSFYLNNIVKLENEETRTILVSLQIIKDQIRIPKITIHNKYVKDEIIQCVEKLLALEDIHMSDLIDFSNVMIQKFDKCMVEGKNLILIKGIDKIKCRIKNNAQLIEKNLVSSDILFQDDGKISLSDLKSMSVIDLEKQKQLKNYIDDLVFALYFNVFIPTVGLDKTELIRSDCLKNKYYKET